MFCHFDVDIPSTGLASNWTGVLPASTNVNLTHGDFEIYNNETAQR